MINISSMFVKSPFKQLRDHMDKVIESIAPLKDLFEALNEQNFSKVEEIQQQISIAEEEADTIKNEVRNHLPRNIFMPINRRDLLEMLDMQDTIADVAQDIANLLFLRKMCLPEDLSQEIIQFVEKSQSVCYMAQGLSREFGDVLESGFGRHEIKKLLGMIDQVSIAETEADDLEDALVRKMFEVEDKMKPVDVVFWYEVFEWIGDLADYSKKTGSRLRLMIAHN
jgi:predicted phosphate transport protein (TIGR00153 family)